MIKLNKLVLKFVPKSYMKYLKENMDTKIIVRIDIRFTFATDLSLFSRDLPRFFLEFFPLFLIG